MLGMPQRALALAYHALGRSNASDEALTEFISRFQSVEAYQVAGVYAFRHQLDESFRWLERAYSQRDGRLFLRKPCRRPGRRSDE